MTRYPAAAARQGSPGPSPPELLVRAVGYALDSAASVSPARLRCPTPCRGWDLRALLHHACESVQALHQGICAGRVSLAAGPDRSDQEGSAAQAFARGAAGLLEAWSQARWPVILIGDRGLTADVLAEAAALELAVHGWDISQACGDRHPMPAALARELAEIAQVLVTRADRGVLFGEPVAVAGTASPTDQLAAFLGRAPLARSVWTGWLDAPLPAEDAGQA